MIVTRRFPLHLLLGFTARLAGMIGVWAAIVFAAYFYGGITILRVPLSRAIEIDLREMLGETELPPKEEPAGFVLY